MSNMVDLIRDSNGNLIKVKINNTNASAEVSFINIKIYHFILNFKFQNSFI